jgi:hypothetical protein
MATAKFSGQYGHNMTLEVWSGWNKPDAANNRSTVNVQARLITNGYASMWGVTADLTITINGGSAIEHPAINIGTNSSQLIFAHDYLVGHNDNGSKTVGIKISVNLNTGGYGSSMVAFDLKLSDIPRASSGSVTSGDLGTPVKISIDRKVSSFKHTLRYNWGGLSGTIASNVDTSYSWTLPMNFANEIPNATSGWGRVYIDTYNGSTKVGTKEATFKGNVPESVKPTLGSITLTDGNTTVSNLLNTANTFAEIVSDVKVGFTNAKGSYGSTIKEYKAEIVGKNQSVSENNGNFGIMNWNGEAQVKAWVVDSRGRSSNVATTDITVLEYFLPTLTFTAVRGDTNQSSDKIVVTRTAKVAPLKIGNTQKNSFKLSFKTAPFGTETYTVDTNAGVNDRVTHELINSQATLSGTFDVGKSYEVYGVLEDALTSSGIVKAPPVSPEKMVMGMAENAVSFGKFPENTNAVDSDWVYKYKNKEIQHYQLTANNGTAIMLTDGSDLNDVTSPGCYNGSNLLHAPANGWNYIRVTKHTNNNGYVLQEAIAFYGNVSAYRVQTNKTWGSWQYYAVQNKVAEFTAVNQTKVYKTTLAGPYGFGIEVTRSGNVVTATMDYIHRSNTNWSGTANETIPVGWRPVSQAIINAIGEGGGGTGASLFNGSYVHLSYKPDGSISGRIKLEANPLWFGATISWITTDPFPS